MSAPPPIEIVDLAPEHRGRALPVILDGFTGIYRWHAKRTLERIELVRAAMVGSEIAGISMLEHLTSDVGYVYYLAVATAHRRAHIGGELLDDALRQFRLSRLKVAYGAVEEENAASIRLFESRGFGVVARKERGYEEGGLGAWGLRSRMMLVPGEILLGLRLDEGHPTEPPRRPA